MKVAKRTICSNCRRLPTWCRCVRWYVGIPESDDWQHVGEVVVMAGGALDAEQYKLDPRTDLRNLSPTGFAWSYGGSGPAQLALAILADASGDDELAVLHHSMFKREKIHTLPAGPWEMTSAGVREWLAGVAA